jgi:peroxiredoxin
MMLLAITVAAGITAVVLVCGVSAYQILRQNGWLIRRRESVEGALEQLAPSDGGTRAGGFGDRSPAGSRINRDGLPPGTEAPAFRLPRVGGGALSLQDYSGRRLMLVFSDPGCGPCHALAPQLEALWRQPGTPSVLMISRGDLKANERTIEEHALTFPVVLQQQWEVSREYGTFAMPMAYLIDEEGVIASKVAVGVTPILALMSRPRAHEVTRASGHVAHV